MITANRPFLRAGLSGLIATAVVFGLEAVAPVEDQDFPLVWVMVGLAIVHVGIACHSVFNPAKFKTLPKLADGTQLEKKALLKGLGQVASAFVLIPLLFGFVVYRISGYPYLYLIFVAVSLASSYIYRRRIGAIARTAPEDK